ncbi:MAG TPA: serine/threonine-protein kinase [Polyangia bacterium]|nr:serine/threonine-protein kinase [Polyangia bacterium]
MIGKSIGNYQIKAKLGEGGMGAVYLGEHPLIGKRVAIKVLLQDMANKEEIVARFFTEAKAVNDIGHPNIVDIVDFGKQKMDGGGESFYLIMEFLDGESLAARMRRTSLSIEESLHVIGQCCSALAASHKKGIVHRDLKPDNVFLVTRGGDPNFVKLLDFGIAKLTGNTGNPASYKTRTGSIFGTPAYMSPEQCEGTARIDHRSDVYSLGVVMYQLLTGRVPFPGEGFGEIIVGHMTRPPEKPSTINPDVPEEVEAIVLHALEKPRERRFQTMDEFGAAIANPHKHLDDYRNLATGQTVAGHHKPESAPLMGGTRILSPASVPPEVRQAAERSHPRTGRTRQPVHDAGPKPTTLSGAASEMLSDTDDEGLRPHRSRLPLVLSIVGGVGLAVLLVFALRPKTSPLGRPIATDPTGGETEKPRAEPVSITITSDPPGVHVLRQDQGGAEAGLTPLRLDAKKGDPAFDVQLKLEGYKPERRTLTPDQTKEVVVVMAKEGPPPTETTHAGRPTGSTGSTGPVASDRHHPKHPGGATTTTTTATDRTKPDKSSKGNKKEDDLKILTPKF